MDQLKLILLPFFFSPWIDQTTFGPTLGSISVVCHVCLPHRKGMGEKRRGGHTLTTGQSTADDHDR